jgi:LmbE family N-acetylglucosaminyl deacetylase
MVTLFLLAHHDDEVFCAAHLRRALTGGGDVRLLWATAPAC